MFLFHSFVPYYSFFFNHIAVFSYCFVFLSFFYLWCGDRGVVDVFAVTMFQNRFIWFVLALTGRIMYERPLNMIWGNVKACTIFDLIMEKHWRSYNLSQNVMNSAFQICRFEFTVICSVPWRDNSWILFDDLLCKFILALILTEN